MTPRAPFDVTIVSAVYDVARYLPDFLASLEAQEGVDLGRVQLVAVDDGSNDESLTLLREWQDRSRLAMTVLTKPNGGQASARNYGLEHARGEWVTFTDPDDTLDPEYLRRVLDFVTEHPDVELVGANLILHLESTGKLSDTHPLKGRFAPGDRVVDLNRTTDLFYASAPAAFFRRSRIEAMGLRFDPAIRPNFEDGHFCMLYLLDCPAPTVGLLRSAKYHYRKRSDGSSTLQNSLADARRYTVVPRAGYLDVLRRATERYGYTPEWMQSLVLYELSWFFGAEAAPGGSATAAVGPVAEEFLGVLRQIRGYLDPQVIESFRLRWIDPVWRQIMLHGLSDVPWHSPCAVLGTADPEQNLVRVSYRFTGPEPVAEYISGGTTVEPAFTKLRAHVYFDRTLMWERIAWVPADALVRVRLAGRLLELRKWWYGPAATSFDPRPKGTPARPSLLRLAAAEPARAVRGLRKRVERRFGASPRRRYRDAWVLMDRIHDADDSAEHLFTYLRDNRPDVNAWFTVESGTADWKRLKAGRHGDRVVAHGSRQWRLLMLSCKHLVSSHIDQPVHRPAEIVELLKPLEPTWRFTFLQHGVIKDDLSRWLNPKSIDLFVTSTRGEHDSIVADGSPYVFGDREVRLTGLPRFDKLRRVAATLRPEDRTLLLVAPTWRHALLPPPEQGSQRRTVRDDFLATEYAQQWLAFLRSEELARTAAEHGLRIGFLPHPNLQSMVPLLDLPDHVEALSFEGANVQKLFAGAAVLVTDYSSMAFNAAYVDRPVVYFQFDADLVRSGGHVGRQGYYEYERDGFGPVAYTAPDAVAAVAEIVGRGCVPAPEYARRIQETFVQRDGRCCERVVAAIERLGERVEPRPAERTRPSVPASRLPTDVTDAQQASPSPV